MDLSKVPTADLLREAIGRSDVEDAHHILSNEAFEFARTFCALPSVDGIPVRKTSSGSLQVGFIRRNTGFYKGKLWMVGGRVLLGESNELALHRSFREVLGAVIDRPLHGWLKPSAVGQYVRDLESSVVFDVGHNPPYQTVSPIYLVTILGGKISFGKTAHGGQEASALEWFSVRRIPPAEEFGYRGHRFIKTALLNVGFVDGGKKIEEI